MRACACQLKRIWIGVTVPLLKEDASIDNGKESKLATALDVPKERAKKEESDTAMRSMPLARTLRIFPTAVLFKIVNVGAPAETESELLIVCAEVNVLGEPRRGTTAVSIPKVPVLVIGFVPTVTANPVPAVRDVTVPPELVSVSLAHCQVPFTNGLLNFIT